LAPVYRGLEAVHIVVLKAIPELEHVQVAIVVAVPQMAHFDDVEQRSVPEAPVLGGPIDYRA
jgi:hypothetical protein